MCPLAVTVMGREEWEVCVWVCVCAGIYFVFTVSVYVCVCVLAPSALLLGELLCFIWLFQSLIVCLIHLEMNIELILLLFFH